MSARGPLAVVLVAASPVIASDPPVLLREPYLQLGTPESAVIRWRTDVPTDAWVAWGPRPDSLVAAVVTNDVGTEHLVQLDGLSPATRYYYAVGSSQGILAGLDSTHTFRTAPVPGTRERVRVWVIGDSGTADVGARRVRDAYLAVLGTVELDVWLMLGDNAYESGRGWQYDNAVFRMYPGILRRTFVWPTRGNHDDLRAGPNNDYYDFFTLPTHGEAGGVPSGTEAYYSFDRGNVHFVCLDSQGSDRTPGSAMLSWLEQDLAANARDWTIAYWHHPPYTKGNHDSDSRSDSDGRLFDMRENALPILEDGGVDLVLTGHSHSYERSFLIDGHYGRSHQLEPWMILDDSDGHPADDGAYRKATLGPGAHEGAVYAVVGSSGKVSQSGSLDHPVMVRSVRDLGSMFLLIDGSQLDAIWLDDDGEVRDTFRIVKEVRTGIADRYEEGPALAAPQPNPFSGGTSFRFTVARAGTVRLSIFDVAGRRVAMLVDRSLEAGAHRVEWSGTAASGDPAAPGVYFAVLETEGVLRTKKVVRTR